MSTPFHPPSPDVVADLRALADEPVRLEDFLRWINTPLTGTELREANEMIDWFQRRYPTVRARLAYCRKAYARACRLAPPSSR